MQSVPCLFGQAEPTHPVKGGHGGARERPAPGWSSPSDQHAGTAAAATAALGRRWRAPLILRLPRSVPTPPPPATRNEEHKRTRPFLYP